MNEDPAIYKVQAVIQLLIWTPFFVRYLRRQIHGQAWKREPEFALAMLILGGAMVLYSLATFLRQFFGLDYFGRDAIRILAALGLSITGLAFHRVLNKWSKQPDTGERRRESDRPV